MEAEASPPRRGVVRKSANAQAFIRHLSAARENSIEVQG